MKKKNFIAPEVLVHEMRKVFTDAVIVKSKGKGYNNTGFAPERQNADFPTEPQDQSGMMESPWD